MKNIDDAPQDAILVKLTDRLLTQPIDIKGAARDEMDQPFLHLCAAG